MPAIMAIETVTFAKDAWSADTMSREVVDPNCFYLVAFPPDEPDRIVAYAGLMAPRGGYEADIHTIAVAEQARGRGLGRTLMLTLIGEARKRDARGIFLEVRADNPTAERLYLRLGFVEVGVRRSYYQPDNVDAIVMRLQIDEPQTTLTLPTFEEQVIEPPPPPPKKPWPPYAPEVPR